MAKKILLYLFVFFYCGFVSSNILKINRISIENGLSSNMVNCIYKDTKGLIWLGTSNGFDSYDGQKIVSYANRLKINNNLIVQSITDNGDGSLWVGTESGAYRYYRNENKLIPILIGEGETTVSSLIYSANGSIYFGTNKGLYYYYPEKQNNPHQIKLVSNNAGSPIAINKLIAGSDGLIWAATKNGIYSINKQNKVYHYRLPKQMGIDNDFTSICQLGNLLYLGMDHVLYSLNISNGQFKLIPEFKNVSILTLESDQNDHLYIGTERNGIIIFNIQTNALRSFSNDKENPNSISANYINSMYLDESGILWSGTFANGFNYFNAKLKNKFRILDIQKGSKPVKIYVRSFYRAPNNITYIGTLNGLVIVGANNQIIKTFTMGQKNGLRANIITTIIPFPEKSDLLLVGTFEGGASILNTKTLVFSDFSKDNVFQKGTIYNFSTGKKGILWIATLNGLYLYHLAQKTLERYDATSVIGNNLIYSVKEDRSGRVWVGSRTGLYMFSKSLKIFFQTDLTKKIKFHTTVINTDKKDNIWIGTIQGGAYRIDHDLMELNSFTTANNLPDNDVSGVLEDSLGNIWIATPKGIGIINLATNSTRTIDAWDGLPGLAFSPGAFNLDDKGLIWWGNEGGLLIFNPKTMEYNDLFPPIILTDVFVNGNRISADTMIGIQKVGKTNYSFAIKGKNNNNLSFNVAALNYLNHNANRYSFMLEGYDSKWSRPSTISEKSWDKLDAGTYILKIKASNNDNVWTPQPLEIEFSITPYYYETTWFILLIILIGCCITFYFTRNYIIKTKNKIINQLDERKKQIKSKKNEKLLNDKGLLIKNTLTQYMETEKPYLNASLKLADISLAIGFSVHDISLVLNTQLNQNFNDFVNTYRIKDIKTLISNGDGTKLTLAAIALQCGFNSKTSFYRDFRKLTGASPAEFFKGLLIEDLDPS